MNQQIFSIVRKTLIDNDPAGVVFDESTSDEYDPEAREITLLLNKKLDSRTLGQEIHGIFEKYFDKTIAGDKSKYDKIATEILKNIDN